MENRLFEFEDLSWWPKTIRDGMTDYLGFILNKLNLYEPVVPILLNAFDESRSAKIIDLCSGGGGPVKTIQQVIQEKYGRRVQFVLSDKYPNLPAFKEIGDTSENNITYMDEPVDATNVPVKLVGMRTIFSGFHHFNITSAKAVIKDAVEKQQAIAVFDGGDKNLLVILAIIIGHPILFLFLTPFFKPFRLSRIIFTYLLPLIPLCTVWDGVVSILRLYRPEQLLLLANEAGPVYKWTAGKVKNKYGMKITYLVGIPPAIT
jgi:hypothetical protein